MGRGAAPKRLQCSSSRGSVWALRLVLSSLSLSLSHLSIRWPRRFSPVQCAGTRARHGGGNAGAPPGCVQAGGKAALILICTRLLRLQGPQGPQTAGFARVGPAGARTPPKQARRRPACTFTPASIARAIESSGRRAAQHVGAGGPNDPCAAQRSDFAPRTFQTAQWDSLMNTQDGRAA